MELAIVHSSPVGEQRKTKDFGSDVTVRVFGDVEELYSHLEGLSSSLDAVVDMGTVGEDWRGIAEASGANYLGFKSRSDDIDTRIATAKSQGATVLFGVGHFTAVASAAVKELRNGMEEIGLIDIATELLGHQEEHLMSQVLSSNHTQCWRGGEESRVPIWSESKTLALPGGEKRHVYIMGGPETALIGHQVGARSVVTRTRARQPIVNDLLHGCAALMNFGMSMKMARRLAVALENAKASDCELSGLSVSVSGIADGKAVKREWTMEVPTHNITDVSVISPVCLLKRLRQGYVSRGARLSLEKFSLSEWSDEASMLETNQKITEKSYSFVFQEAWGPLGWDSLPEEIRRTHKVWDQEILEGSSSVERGTNIVSRAVCTFLGFPNESESVPVKVTKTRGSGMLETWKRDFGGSVVTSYLQPGGPETPLGTLYESFTPFTLQLRLHMQRQACGRLALKYDIVKGWAFGFLPLPTWILPTSNISEYVQDGVFHFDVDITLPFFGRMVRYRGSLA